MTRTGLAILILTMTVVLGLVGLVLGRSLWIAHGYAQLLRVDADTIPARPTLAVFAQGQGRALYGRVCAGCHGAGLEGNPARGVPNLKDADWLYGEGRVSEIEQTITHGVRSGDPKGRSLAAMPAYGTANPYDRYKIPPLDPGDLRDVTEYVVGLSRRPVDAAAAARGEAVYHGRGGCYDCHGPDGHGDGAIGAANLTDAVWLYGDGSRAAIAQSIAQGRAGVCPPWINRLTAGEIRAVSVFVHTSGHPGP